MCCCFKWHMNFSEVFGQKVSCGLTTVMGGLVEIQEGKDEVWMTGGMKGKEMEGKDGERKAEGEEKVLKGRCKRKQ